MNEINKRLMHIKWLQTNAINQFCSQQDHIEPQDFVQNIINMQSNHKKLPPIIAHNEKIKNNIFEQPLIKNIGDEMNNDNIILARKLADNASNIEELYAAIRNFDGCELKKFAQNTVLCDGQKDAKIMLIGEAPGEMEDIKGISFCGPSGILLDSMLKSINVSRKTNAYISNTVFWRPPANRKPTSEEIELCRPFVEKHIALINPKLIILVGATATTSLLNQGDAITNLRGTIYNYTNQYLKESIKTTAIFHPAYLLRQPLKKKDTWYDLLKIKDILTKYNI